MAGWRNELYAIYASPRSSVFAGKSEERTPLGNAAFACERAACAVWGFATFGVHMTGACGVGAAWCGVRRAPAARLQLRAAVLTYSIRGRGQRHEDLGTAPQPH